MEKRELLISSTEFFQQAVDDGFSKRNIKSTPAVKSYLVSVLEHHLDAKNLFDSELNQEGEKNPTTLAEMYLRANMSPPAEKQLLLKKLGDRSLYISGFFGDSLATKLVDIDYYMNMGGAAYRTLSDCVKEDTAAMVYRTFAQRFIDFVEVLTYISQQSIAPNDQNILRLYDRYLRTGSSIAKEKLEEFGVVTLPPHQLKLGRQD